MKIESANYVQNTILCAAQIGVTNKPASDSYQPVISYAQFVMAGLSLGTSFADTAALWEALAATAKGVSVIWFSHCRVSMEITCSKIPDDTDPLFGVRSGNDA
jgi:hypothetical protein